jgi:hypothetical protein
MPASNTHGYLYAGTSVEYLCNVPAQPHWVVLEQKQYSTDHGYPESGSQTYGFLSYRVFTDEKEMMEYITVNFLTDKAWKRSDPTAFKVLFVKPAPVEVTVNVKLAKD